MAIALSGEGGMNLRVAEQYVEQFGKIAKEGNTLVIPADLSNVASMVALASKIGPATLPKSNGTDRTGV